jgi:cell division septation protein DedD
MAADEESPPQLRIPTYVRDEPEAGTGSAPPRDVSTVQSARLRGRDLGFTIFLAAALGLVVLFVLVRDSRMSEHLERMQNSLTRLSANEPAEPSTTQLRIVERRLRDLEVALASQPQGVAGGVPETERLAKLEEQVAELRGVVEQLKREPAPKAEAPAQKTQQTAPASAAKSAEAGGWVVQLSAVGDRKDAQALADKARKSGYQAAIEETTAKGKTYFRVMATGFESHDQAADAAKRLRKDLGLSEDPWVAARK